MANREVRWLLFHPMGQVGVGEAVNPREDRGRTPACLQSGDGEGHSMWSFGGVKSCFGVQDGQ